MRKRVAFYAFVSLLVALPSFGGTLSICDHIAGNLVRNCGFETGDFTDWTHSGSSAFTFIGSRPHSGNDVATIGPFTWEGLSYESQVVNTGAGSYELSFYLAHTGNCSGLTDCSQAVVTWNGTTLLDDLNVGKYGYAEFSYPVTATGPSTLKFGFASDPGYYYLDDVCVVPGTPTPTPEPGTFGLALLGSLAGLLFGVRKVDVPV